MRGGIRIGMDVELRDEIPPAKELSPERGSAVDLHGEVHQPQDALIGQVQAGPVLGTHPAGRPIHFIADHQDLLVEVECRPAFRREGGVLGHGMGSPWPISAEVISRTRSRIAGSAMSMLRFPWAGRMLINDVYSMQPSGPFPG